ncbi:MAG: MFS transporter [Bacteroidales bacterium]|nr:MFS transporter [Bacteroidales bacterium]
MQNKNFNPKLYPVLFGFFIMGFVDVVGISTSYVKSDFGLSDTLANLLPMMVFLWFAVFSVPTGLLMNKLGRRNTVLISMAFTFIAMLIPFFSYTFVLVLIAFAFLGIGNTILQVSLNPLLTNVVRGDRLTSSLTLGQFIKAIASFLGPIIAGVAASKFGNWKLIFPVFAVVTLLSSLWLLATPIKESEASQAKSSFGACFGLLGDKVILMLFLGILAVVGLDVGLNTIVPKFLMEKCQIPLEEAGLGTSLYFAARTLGTFIGAILLVKISAAKFFRINILVAIAAMAIILFVGNLWGIAAMVFVLGFSLANVFSIIFSAAIQRLPDRANEISGLMIMGVAGGAVFPFLMGLATDYSGTQSGGMLVLFAALVYLLFAAFRVKDAKK